MKENSHDIRIVNFEKAKIKLKKLISDIKENQSSSIISKDKDAGLGVKKPSVDKGINNKSRISAKPLSISKNKSVSVDKNSKPGNKPGQIQTKKFEDPNKKLVGNTYAVSSTKNNSKKLPNNEFNLYNDFNETHTSINEDIPRKSIKINQEK